MPASQPVAPAYPPVDPGFAALPTDALLSANEDVIGRIRLCFGIDKASFERDVQTLLRRYAAFVHLLPATATNYFSAPGGLLRLGLEVAFFSLQGTDAHIFSGRSTISTRRRLEPRWRQATFIGGLCCELHRVLSHVIVTEPSGEEWPAYLQPLADWLESRGAQRYYVNWRPQSVEMRGLGILALPHVVPADMLQFLSADNAVIVPHLLASIGGVSAYRDHNVLDGLVRRSLALVIDRNLQANADRYGAPQFGSHLERYLVDALRRLASTHSAWVPNRDKSRVWFARDGVFLAWPQAAIDVQAVVETDGLAGIPKAPETILELLLAAGVLEPQASGQHIWTIQPPGAKHVLEAVRLASAALLFADIDPSPVPLDVDLVPKAGTEGAAAPPSPPMRAAPSGTQYSLIDPPAPIEDVARPGDTPVPVVAAAPEPPGPRPPSLPALSLTAPMRLHPAVRDALTAVVETLNAGTAAAAACTVSTGLFVPLHELERRGIQPAVALRALAEVHMLVHSDPLRPATLSRDFAGTTTVGLVIDPRFIGGFDLEAFVITDPTKA